MRRTMSNIIREKCGDGQRHKIKTTGFPTMSIDNVEVYRTPSFLIREARRFPLVAMGIGFAIGLLVGHFWTLLFY